MRMLRHGVMLAALLSGSAATADAQSAKRSARPKVTLEEVAVMLSSQDAEELRTALESAAMLPAPEVLPLVDGRVRSGLPFALLEVALDTIVLLADPAAEPLLTELTRHRRATIRVRAIDALARTGAARSAEIATRALGDVEPSVRSAAAASLALLGPKSGAQEPLTRAVAQEVDGAAEALGRVARASDLDGLLKLLESQPFERVAPMVEPLLARGDLALPEKLRVVDALGKLGSDDARAELTRLQSALPQAAAPLKRALAQAAAAGAAP